MAVSILGTPTSVSSGGSYTAETGANLVVFAINSGGAGGAASISSVTFGGVACTIAVQYNESGSEFGLSGIAYLKAADIPSGAQTVSVTVSAGTVDAVRCYSLSGVDQTSTVRSTATQEVTAASDFNVSVTSSSGDYGVLAGHSGNAAAGVFATYTNAWTEDFQTDIAGAHVVVSASVACDGTDSVVITHGANFGRKSLALAVFAAAAGTTIYTRKPLDSPVFHSRVIQ